MPEEAVHEEGEVATDPVEEETTPSAEPVEEVAEVATAPEAVEEAVELEVAEEAGPRDAATPVASADEAAALSPQERTERINYLVANPEERTAYDPVSADGAAVGDRAGDAQ